MNLFYQPRLSEGITSLDGDEAHHALRVMRLKVGDEISVTDGKGLMADAVILKDSGEFGITQRHVTRRLNYSINLFVAPTKNSDRMEWLVEKATEIGVHSVTMVRCERSERKNISHDRLVKVAVSAMKQSQQSWLPVVRELALFEDVIKGEYDQKFIAFVDHTNPDHLKNVAEPGGNYSVLIGPEGDFTEKEIALATDHKWRKVSLGPTRLRTETAALAAILTLVLSNT